MGDESPRIFAADISRSDQHHRKRRSRAVSWSLYFILSGFVPFLWIGYCLDMLPLRPRLRFPALRAASAIPASRRYATEARLSSEHVRIVEVGPRDGLQNEKKSIPKETKLELIRRLANTGLTTIEAGSFVPAKWVPQVRFEPVHGYSMGAQKSGWRGFWDNLLIYYRCKVLQRSVNSF